MRFSRCLLLTFHELIKISEFISHGYLKGEQFTTNHTSLKVSLELSFDKLSIYSVLIRLMQKHDMCISQSIRLSSCAVLFLLVKNKGSYLGYCEQLFKKVNMF